jgi:homoserine O-succinyltransferase|tara:strand:- start:7361 stop:8365 length:1005 start_codon:yes stop_codon:yes gene_type:complete
MPLVQHNSLPSIQRIAEEGGAVISAEQLQADLPSLRIGFLNMMPDKALLATERQFLRLLAGHSEINCYFLPFTITGVQRQDEALQYVQSYYQNFEQIQQSNLDALIITGANVTQTVLAHESFWQPLQKVLHWAQENVSSTLCSCLATHAAAKVFYQLDRHHLGDKCWGVFEHEVVSPKHPLVSGISSHFDMCHSRFNDISEEQFEEAGVETLVRSHAVGVQLASDADMRMVFFQGHPEYDDISLLKEYKREIFAYLNKQRDIYPPLPAAYFDSESQKLLQEYETHVLSQQRSLNLIDSFPDKILSEKVTHSWRQPALQIFHNWLSCIKNQRQSI